MDWKESFQEGQKIVLATSSIDGKPNANIVKSFGFVDGKIIIANCQMSTTINNLKTNPKYCSVSGYYRISGKVEVFDSGKYFDICIEKTKYHDADNAILLSIDKVFNLDEQKEVI